MLAIGNGFVYPRLARVILWTDWGVPTLAFDVYLPGLDVQSFNVRGRFSVGLTANGLLPLCGEPTPVGP